MDMTVLRKEDQEFRFYNYRDYDTRFRDVTKLLIEKMDSNFNVKYNYKNEKILTLN